MIDKALSRSRRVTQPLAAAAFSDPLRRRIVLLFARRTRALSDVAAETGIDLKRLHYHAGALCRLGLLKVVGNRRRGGRPIKLYRSVADAFFVPAEAAPIAPGAALARELDEALATLRVRRQEGSLYYLSEDGKPQMRPVMARPHAGSPGAEIWRMLKLSPADAERLAGEVGALLSAYAQAPKSEAMHSYLVHFALAPSKPGAGRSKR